MGGLNDLGSLPMICRCGGRARCGVDAVYGFVWAGCGVCGIYTSAGTAGKLTESWKRRVAYGLADVPPEAEWD